MTPPTATQIKTAIVSALPSTFKYTGQPGEQSISRELDSFLRHICTHIANAWQTWQTDVRYYGAIVNGAGIVTWNGTGIIGNFSTQMMLTIPALADADFVRETDQIRTLRTSIQNRFKAAFNQWVTSYQFGSAPSFASAQFQGTSTATWQSPGTFRAELIPTLLTRHGSITLLNTLKQDIESDLTVGGFILRDVQQLTYAISNTLQDKFRGWREATYVRNNMVSGTAMASTGTGSATSGVDGEVT